MSYRNQNFLILTRFATCGLIVFGALTSQAHATQRTKVNPRTPVLAKKSVARPVANAASNRLVKHAVQVQSARVIRKPTLQKTAAPCVVPEVAPLLPDSKLEQVLSQFSSQSSFFSEANKQCSSRCGSFDIPTMSSEIRHALGLTLQVKSHVEIELDLPRVYVSCGCPLGGGGGKDVYRGWILDWDGEKFDVQEAARALPKNESDRSVQKFQNEKGTLREVMRRQGLRDGSSDQGPLAQVIDWRGSRAEYWMKLYPGDLNSDVFVEHFKTRDPLERLEFSVALAKGLQSIHAFGATVGDLKTDNILIKQETKAGQAQHFVPRWIDFGGAVLQGEEKRHFATLRFLPPEAGGDTGKMKNWMSKKVNHAQIVKADNYGLALVLFSVQHPHAWSGTQGIESRCIDSVPPTNDEAEGELTRKCILQEVRKFLNLPTDKVSSCVNRVLEGGLVDQPASRFTAEQMSRGLVSCQDKPSLARAGDMAARKRLAAGEYRYVNNGTGRLVSPAAQARVLPGPGVVKTKAADAVVPVAPMRKAGPARPEEGKRVLAAAQAPEVMRSFHGDLQGNLRGNLQVRGSDLEGLLRGKASGAYILSQTQAGIRLTCLDRRGELQRFGMADEAFLKPGSSLFPYFKEQCGGLTQQVHWSTR